MRGIPNPGARTFTVGQGEGATHGTRGREGLRAGHLQSGKGGREVPFLTGSKSTNIF
jgi:hypothetical protein